MKRLAFLAFAAALFTFGCGHLELSSEGDQSRVLSGEVDLGEPRPLPAGTVVTVRIVIPATATAPEQVLGAQTIKNPGVCPVPFRIEYQADDEVLKRGLNLEARVSWDGALRFYNHTGHSVSLGNAADPHRISVTPVGH